MGIAIAAIGLTLAGLYYFYMLFYVLIIAKKYIEPTKKV